MSEKQKEWFNAGMPDEPECGNELLCTMPRELTAENGAKSLLIGEFWAEAPDGSKTMIEWTTIKEIYAMTVKELSEPLNGVSAQSNDKGGMYE